MDRSGLATIDSLRHNDRSAAGERIASQKWQCTLVHMSCRTVNFLDKSAKNVYPSSMQNLRTMRGRSLPLGATALADGVNFAVLCRHGTAVWLMLYPIEGEQALAEITLDPLKNRTGNHWHIQVAGLPPAFRY